MTSLVTARTDPHSGDEASGTVVDRPNPADLGGHVRRGLAWKAASQVTAQIVRTGMTIVLAHLLAPSDFGLAGLVLVFSGLIQLFADVGFSASLVQFPALREEDRSTAFWTGLGVATLLFGIAVIAAPSVASFYDVPRLRWMFVATASCLLTTALSTVQASLLWRRMEFRALEIRGILATLVSAGVAISAALAGLGAWSLILQANAAAVTSMVAIWMLSPWRPRFMFSVKSLRRMAGYNANVFFARFLDYGDRNVDNLLVGRFLGAGALGIYSIGYSVIVIPFERLVDPVRNVMTPAMASLQGDIDGMRALWLRGVRAMASIIFPAMAGIIVVCPEFVSVVLGDRWSPAARVIQILAWVALIQSVAFLSASVYQSCYRSGLLLRLCAIGFVLDFCAFAVGLHWGVVGVAASYALVNTLILVPLSLMMIMRLLKCAPTALAASLRGVIEATTAMAVCAAGLNWLLAAQGVNATVRLVLVIVAGFVSYILACRWRAPRVFDELRLGRLRTVNAV